MLICKVLEIGFVRCNLGRMWMVWLASWGSPIASSFRNISHTIITRSPRQMLKILRRDKVYITVAQKGNSGSRMLHIDYDFVSNPLLYWTISENDGIMEWLGVGEERSRQERTSKDKDLETGWCIRKANDASRRNQTIVGIKMEISCKWCNSTYTFQC